MKQVTLTITIKIWTNSEDGLPEEIRPALEEAFTHAQQQFASDYVAGEICPSDEDTRGWWNSEISYE